MVHNAGKFWKISPGDRGYQWEEWSERGVAAIGFGMIGRIGELSQYDSVEDLNEKYHELGVAVAHQRARQLWRFAKDVQLGDFLVAYKLYHVVDVGVVTGECTCEWDKLAKDDVLFAYRRRVKWLGLESHEVTGKSSRKFMSRNLTIFLIDDENTGRQVRNLLKSADNRRQLPKSHRRLLNRTPKASDIAKPQRVKTETYRILRDTEKSKGLKEIYDNRCQICGKRIDLPDSCHYSEVHHIRPLGGSHSGPDAYSNMLCLCPWHHAEMDMRVLYIDPKKLPVVHSNEDNRYHGRKIHVDNQHSINIQYLVYNRDRICSDWSD